jgi:hypothetical protein
MNKRYLAGRNREYRLRKRFKKSGYLVLRCAVSRPVDLVLLKKGKCECGREIPFVRLIESKMEKRKYVRPRQRREFDEIEKITGIKVEVI